jgi:hypothetical protein
MIAALSEYQTLGDLSRLLIAGIIGFAVGIFTRWPLEKLSERRALLKTMGDRYIADAQANMGQQGDELWRLGMLQKVGAAGLNARALSCLCDRIVSHGLRDPRHREISTVFKDRRRSLRELLRWASQESIDLSDGSALLRRHAEEIDDARSGSHSRKCTQVQQSRE